ncbi:MAG: hypothetical protein JO184_04455 [Gammaproteobacteria bacterium]|nr:hypothetical protein [Gammaproteobacteria bacterium]
MNRAPLLSRVRLRQLFLCSEAIALGAAATAHAATDGLSVGGLTQWAAIAERPYTFTPTVTNPSGRPLVFGIVNRPPWAALDRTTGRLYGTPPNIVEQYGSISITVTDGVRTASTAPFSIRVYPPDTSDKPIIGGNPATHVLAGTRYAFQPSVRDAFGQELTFSVKNKPAWASFSIATGSLYGTPASTDTGTYQGVEISVTNGEMTASLPAFTIAVGNDTTSEGRATLSWQPPSENTNGSALTDLAGTRIYYGSSAAELTEMVEVPSAGETSYTIGDLTPGTWYFALAAYTADGTESAQSPIVSASIP